MAVVAVPWSLSDLETTREIRGLEPAPVLCTTAIKVSKEWGEMVGTIWRGDSMAMVITKEQIEG